MVEEGYVQPGWMVVASDSHSNMYGALGCLGTPVVRTDAAGVWATGATWWQVPSVARVTLTGRLRRERGVSGKDVVLALCGLFGRDEVLNHAVEFAGDGVQSLGMEERMTIANMTTEWGALAGVFPVDECTVDFLAQRSARLRAKYGGGGGGGGKEEQQASAQQLPPRVLASERIARELQAALQASGGEGHGSIPPSLLLGDDDDEEGESADGEPRYAKELVLDLSALPPLVAGPNAIKAVQPAAALARERVPVHKAYIVSCVNSRVGDLAAAAAVLKGKRVAPGVELYIAAASSEVEAESRARGDWQALVDAGGWVGSVHPGMGATRRDLPSIRSFVRDMSRSHPLSIPPHLNSLQTQAPSSSPPGAGPAWGSAAGSSRTGRWPSRRRTGTSRAAWAPATPTPTSRPPPWWPRRRSRATLPARPLLGKGQGRRRGWTTRGTGSRPRQWCALGTTRQPQPPPPPRPSPSCPASRSAWWAPWC